MKANHAIGERVLRLEDGPLLRGHGRFVDDLKFAGMLEAAFVRSPHAHAGIRGIDTAAARRLPGVQAVYTAADLAPLLTAERLPLQFRTDQLPADVAPFVLAKDEVAFVGEAVAVVIARTRAIAEDAAALVEVDYEPLPAISDCRAALRPGAALAHRGKASNLLIEFRQAYGDVAGAFARAPHRAVVHLKQHRGGAHSMEGRGAVAVYDPNDERLTLWTSTQLAHEVRAFLMRLLQLDENRLRVVAPDVGGGFGAKFVMYPEEVVLCAASLKLHRPIKWIEDRREHFCAAVQERDQYWDIEVAFDQNAQVLGVRGELIHDQGAYTPQGLNLPYNASTGVPGPYIVPAYELRVRVVEPKGRFISADDYIAHIGPRTRVISASLVRFDNGALLDAARVAHAGEKVGAALMLDLAQCAGAMTINLRELGASMAVCSGYKWLLGPYGTGFFWVASEWIERLPLGAVYFMGLEGAREFHAMPSGNLRPAPGARRWDSAEPASFTNLAAFESSLDLVLRIGMEAVERYNDALVCEIIDGLPRTNYALASPRERQRRGPFVCVSAGDPKQTLALYEKLLAAQVSVSLRENALRVSPHIYNTPEEISHFMEILSE